MRQALASGEFKITDDAAKSVDEMIACADEPQPPLRLPLGSAAHSNIHKALGDRLRALEAVKRRACAADA